MADSLIIHGKLVTILISMIALAEKCGFLSRGESSFDLWLKLSILDM